MSYLDTLPTTGNARGRGFRDVELEQKVLRIARRTGIGTQLGGKYFCHDVRVIHVDLFQAQGGRQVMLAKGNRSAAVTAACDMNKPKAGKRLGVLG